MEQKNIAAAVALSNAKAYKIEEVKLCVEAIKKIINDLRLVLKFYGLFQKIQPALK